MARVTGIFQGVRGKLGNVVFRTRNGKTFLSQSPVFRKGKQTERQNTIRTKFAFTIAFVKRLMFLLRRTYQHIEKGKTGFNRAVSHNYREAVMGNCEPYQINYPKVVLSKGSLKLPEMMMAASLLPGTLTFIWTDDSLPYKTDIKVFIAMYCEETNNWSFDIDNANITDCMLTVEFPYYRGKAVHTYIGFFSTDGHKVSDSYYTGMVNIL